MHGDARHHANYKALHQRTMREAKELVGKRPIQ